MGGEFEAAGAMATAGLAAGAIEGSEASRAGHGECLNCEAQTSGRYCSNCGQATHPHRSLWHVVEELLHNLFHFDTKAWRTLPMVAFRPGTLTRNFVYGKRARYISPLATFLLSVFFMFFVFSLIPMPAQMQLDPSAREEAQADLTEARGELAEAEAELATERRDAQGDTSPGARVGVQVAQQAVTLARQEVERREAALARAIEREREEAAAPPDAATTTSTATSTTQAETVQPQAQVTTTATTAPEGAPPAPPQTPQPPAAESRNPYPEGSLDYSLFELSRSSNFSVNGQTQGVWVERIRAKLSNPPLLRYQLTEVTYKFSFLLVPISLPFIAFLFLFKRGITLYDHVVYALYALSFASLLFVLTVTAGQVPWLRWVPGVAIGIGLPIHTYFHLKGAYALGWWSALWRTFFMLTFALVSLIIFLIIILVVGFLG
ncbi:DUF3667 domain-containing protein [Terricaulis sp.]|uniref:DUF3667 domain-containing protein n=1 Tax=Terricaulis sp. TaxID=2768686 RepID=UPI003784B223